MEKSGEKVANWGENVGTTVNELKKRDEMVRKTGVRLLPKRGRRLKKLLKKRDEMFGKQGATVAKKG